MQNLICTSCSTEKPAADFPRGRRCRSCFAAYMKKWRLGRLEKCRAAEAARRKTEKHKKWMADWAIRNRERRVAYRISRRARTAETRRAWRSRNIEISRARRTAARVGGRREGERHEVEYMAILQRDPCAYCGGQFESIDHVTPLWHGGSLSWENLAPSCRRCNSSKGTRTLLRFLMAA